MVYLIVANSGQHNPRAIRRHNGCREIHCTSSPSAGMHTVTMRMTLVVFEECMIPRPAKHHAHPKGFRGQGGTWISPPLPAHFWHFVYRLVPTFRQQHLVKTLQPIAMNESRAPALRQAPIVSPGKQSHQLGRAGQERMASSGG